MIESLDKLRQAMGGDDIIRLYAKPLAPNDNSKNQVYLGGGFTALNIIPHGNIYTDGSPLAGSIRDRAKANIEFSWLTDDGLSVAPNAGLILYPRYPEVRMSGFLSGCKNAPSDVMTSRDEGRVLFLGVSSDNRVIGYAVFNGHPLASEFFALSSPEQIGVFTDLSAVISGVTNARAQLLKTLKSIYEKQWIASTKLNRQGLAEAYAASNGGGYTLEAELGISPNGLAEPDYWGWEVKQYGVTNFEQYRAKSPITLMTPEPDGGVYRQKSLSEFMARFGYPDKNGKPDRLNFGGIYTCNKEFHPDTGLSLVLDGYDATDDTITNMGGAINLVAEDETIAASWSFSSIMRHWNHKHAKAVYVPSLFRKPPPEYRYGGQIQLCENTDFILFLKAISKGMVYYDPGIKLEGVSGDKPRSKKRSQFRIKNPNLSSLYHKHEIVNLFGVRK